MTRAELLAKVRAAIMDVADEWLAQDRPQDITDAAAEAIRIVREVDAKPPICIGRELIGILAAEGAWTSEHGASVVAADSLFRNDPYAERDEALEWADKLRDAITIEAMKYGVGGVVESAAAEYDAWRKHKTKA